jgi:hypothetical protein
MRKHAKTDTQAITGQRFKPKAFEYQAIVLKYQLRYLDCVCVCVCGRARARGVEMLN